MCLLSADISKLGKDSSWTKISSNHLARIFSTQGFPCGSAGKESICNVEDLGLTPGLGRSPGEGKGYPLQYSRLENLMDYTVYEVTERRTGLSDFHFHFRLNSCWSLVSFCVWEISRHGGNGGNLETACSVKRGSLPSVPADCCLEMTSIHYCQVISFLQRETGIMNFFPVWTPCF